MGTERVKICPRCQKVNGEYAVFCTNPECKATLMNVQAVDRDFAAKPRSAGDMGRAGKDDSKASSVRPTELLDPAPARLEHAGPPAFVFQIKSGDVVGRAGEVDVSALERSRFISRRHARLLINRGRWYLEPLSQTNETRVDGVKTPPGALYPLDDGVIITLADTNFVFRVGC